MCKLCSNCDATNCLKCCVKCKICNKCKCGSKLCLICRYDVCNNCDPNDDKLNRDCINEDYCNECHYKKECVQCWNVSKYKFLPSTMKSIIDQYLLCLKRKNFLFPKPILNIILQYVVISNTNVRKMIFTVKRKGNVTAYTEKFLKYDV